MRAERFYGDADGPDLVADAATDGTPLPDGRGWTCWACGAVFVGRGDADLCCVGPDAVVEATPRTPGTPARRS